MPQMPPTPATLILTTVPAVAEARRIAKTLVEKRLAACVKILPNVDSTFRWNGAVQKSKEVLLLCTVPQKRRKAAEKQIEALHSYECPVIECIAPIQMNAKAEAWLRSCL